MNVQGSITFWLERLKKTGEAAATEALWKAYYTQLVTVGRRKLGERRLAKADEEDAASMAFKSFFDGVQEGRFPKLEDRDDLWQVLLMLAAQKVRDLQRDERTQKRGGGKRLPLNEEEFANMMGREPTPEIAEQSVEECGRLLDKLGDRVLKQVAVDKLEGYSNAEIAERVGRSVATVERKLGTIRSIWKGELGQ